jgi:hypothetical protein
MTEIAKKLCPKEMILRSGGAMGADQAFERGVDYWYKFMQKNKTSIPKEIFYAGDVDKAGVMGLQAMNEAEKYHVVWSRLGSFVKKLHARNVFQILGMDLKTPVSFVICWTPDGCIHHQNRTIYTGGTGTAISVASMHKIPVFNLARPEHLARIRKGLEI